MPRTFKVASKYIDKVKFALNIQGYATQKLLAEDAELSLDTVNRFLNGQPVFYINFVELCYRLNQDWQEIADLENQDILLSEVDKRPKLQRLTQGQGRLFVELRVTIDEVDKPIIDNFITRLQQVSRDSSFVFKRIQEGSLVLVFEGSKEGCERILSLWQSGRLTELNIFIQDVRLTLNLSQLLQNNLAEAIQAGWLAVEDIFGTRQLAFRDNKDAVVVRRAKQIDLGGVCTIALVIELASETDEQVDIRIKIYSIGNSANLPENIKLTLLSEGEILKEITPETVDDDFLEQPLSGSPGEPFSIKVTLGDISVTEDFVI